MNKGLENIDEVVKQAFDGFEVDVDPSVWSNIQNSIATGPEAAVQSGNSSAGLGKSTVLKFVAGVAAVGAIATTVYLSSDKANNEKENEQIAQELPIEQIQNDFQDSQERELVPKVQNDFTQEKETVIKLSTTNDAQKQKNELVREETNSTSEKQEVLTKEDEITQNISEEKNLIVAESKELVEKNKNQKSEKKLTKTEIKENKILKGRIIASVTSGKAPLDVIFDVEGENIVSYSWDFDDDSELSNVPSPLHTFEKAGDYIVSLTIIDKDANAKTIAQRITVEKRIISTLGFIQDAFSPNGDGTNDVYKLKSAKNIKTFNATIRDVLTGNLVYQWNNIEEGWNGTDVSGRMMDEGTSYALTIYAEGIDGEIHTKHKIISLIK